MGSSRQMKNAKDILSAQARKWVGLPPATENEIAELKKAVGYELPLGYLDLLRESNGGDGELALSPLWFQLWDIAFAIQMATDDFYRSEFDGLFFFGSNGGLESIAFDMRGPLPWPIVMVDCIAGIETAEHVASSIDEFIEAIGLSSVVTGNE